MNPVAATCGTLQTALTNAADGDEITLSGVCTGTYTLKSFPPPGGGNYASWTLKGDPSNGVDGFDRNEVDGRALTGTDVHRLEIQNLTFRDGRQASGNGGAISITAST